MPAAGRAAAAAIPIRLGDAGQFAALRAGLDRAGYDTAGVCERMGIGSIYVFRTTSEGRAPLDPGRDALALLIHVFLDGQIVKRAVLERLLEPPTVQAMDALGLLRELPDDTGRCLATVLLYPTESLWIVSDRDYDPTTEHPERPVLTADSVYPAITPNTGDFLSMLPGSSCGRVLDLCSGTGIAALVQARRAGHAWAVDVTERSTLFARFNAALNGVDNVTALQGDLYDAVAGESFDRIIAHPPYMPALEETYIYRDGGADGEQITRRVIEGLPRFLSPGGTFHCSCMATDRRDAPLQDRIRAMLGSTAGEYDIIVATLGASPPREHYATELADGKVSADAASAHVRALLDLGVEQLVVSTIAIYRHGQPRDGITVRRQRGPGAGYPALEWLHRWETAVVGPDVDDQIVGSHPRLSPEVRLHVVSRGGSDGWQAEEFLVETDQPFATTMKSTESVAAFLARCDGRRSLAQHLQELKRSGSVAETTTERQFAGMLMPLLAAGYIEVEAFPLPAAGANPPHSHVEDENHA